MEDAATEFLLNNLKQLLADRPDLIKDDTRGDVENLQRDLGVLKTFLRDTVKERKKNERINEIVKEILDVVYEVEDIIDDFVVKKRNKTLFSKSSTTSAGFHSIAGKVEAIKVRVLGLREEINLPSADPDNHEKSQPPRPRRVKDVVGFADETEVLIQRLTQETEHLDVISIIGMPGLGKTTLAWQIFTNIKILFHFPTCIWLHISQQFTDRDIFLHILKELSVPINDNISDTSVEDLAHMVSGLLEKQSFLIVMDDVWSDDDWHRLRMALPSNNKYGRVLITSRSEEVGMFGSRARPPYRCRGLTYEESWELLRLEALGKLDCPPELEDVGREIAKICDGQPIAIVVTGGILAAVSLGSSTIATRKAWEKVSTHLTTYLADEKYGNRMQKFLSFSYDNLPYHLRACFLYLGLFREVYEIPASKLIHMWIAEGFVQQELGRSLEETAEKCLEDLIHRNLVKSHKFKLNGKVKTCRILDFIGDFCRSEAATQNFLQEIKYVGYGEFAPSVSDIDKYRRLSIYSNCLDFFSSRPSGHRVRSFVCFPDHEYVVSPENSTNMVQVFKLLRVLDVLTFKFTKIDSDLYNLFHMRYIALSSELSMLPPKFNQLWNIQTLIVNTTSRTLEVKADIWNMRHLRHFKTNASASLPKSTKSDKPSAELQTLGLILVESCTKELSDRAPNLRRLGVRGRLAWLFETRNGSIDSLGKLEHLEKLKLINDIYPKPRREGALGCLPPHECFPSGLKSLTMRATFLSWEHMSTLGLLKKLEVLKLKDHAFVGDTWEVEVGGFHSLEYLHIEETDLALWKASSHHYPKLRSLVLKNCDQLREIPIDLADIPSLQMLELYICKYATKSAREISNAKRKTVLAGGSEFMLSIYPPSE